MVLSYELSLLAIFLERRCLTGGKGYPQCGRWYLSEGNTPKVHGDLASNSGSVLCSECLSMWGWIFGARLGWSTLYLLF